MQLQGINGQQAVLEQVGQLLGEPGRHVVVVAGPQASGVSWVLDEAALMWDGLRGASLIGRGEALAEDRELFPWLMMTLPGNKRLARLEAVKGTAVAGGETVPFIGPLASHLLSEILGRRKKRLAREALMLGEREQDLLFTVQTTASKRRLLLVLDHLDHWDLQSLSLLTLLMAGKLDAFYPALKEAVILIAAPADKERWQKTVGDLQTQTLELQRPSQAALPTAMSALGFNGVLPKQAIESLYEITDGRLDLLHELALHLASGDMSRLDGPFLDRLLRKRLDELRKDSPTLIDFIEAAAILGAAFGARDLKCLTGTSDEEFRNLVQLASERGLLNATNPLVRFQGTRLFAQILQRSESKRAQYHQKFAACLRAMRPGEYAYRARHALLGGSIDEALTCWALAVLAARRTQTPEPLLDQLSLTPDWSSFRGFLARMKTAHEAFTAGDATTLHAELDAIEPFLPDALLAERDYLRAQMLLLSHNTTDFAQAATLLRAWTHLEKTESELWSRIAQILFVAHIELNRIDEARQLEKTLAAYYWARREIDPWALYGYNALRRKAECLHQLPTATMRLSGAVAFFGPDPSGDTPRYPLEYYYSLNNLTANLIASGQHGEASLRAAELDRLIERRASIPWPHIEVPTSNLVLAGFLTGQTRVGEAVQAMRLILDGEAPSGDHVLMQNNLAVYLLHAGHAEEAQQVLESAIEALGAKSTADAYHQYFLANNRAGILLATGRRAEAIALFDSAEPLLANLYPAAQQVLKVRHRLMRPAFASLDEVSFMDVDGYLARTHAPQVGPEWRFYGRGFLFSDIQFWTRD